MQGLNLLPFRDVLQKQKTKRIKLSLLIILVASFCFFVFKTYCARRSLIQEQEKIVFLKSEEKASDEQLKTYKNLEQEKESFAQQKTALDKREEMNQSTRAFFRAIQELSMGSLSINVLQKKEEKYLIEGEGASEESVLRVVSELKRLGFFNQVKLNELVIQKSSQKNFSIELF